MRHEQGKTGHDYELYAQHLAEAVEKQQAASRDAVRWQELLDKTEDKITRRYLEGLVKLSTLEALHHNLIARSCERTGQVQAVKRDHEGKAQTVASEPAGPVKPSSEMILIEKCRNKALAEYHAHDAKALAFSILRECYRQLGKDETARAYDDRAHHESVSARGFSNVIKSYDKKLEDLGKAEQASPDLRSSFRTLEHAARYLDNFNSGSARVRNHILRAVEQEPDKETVDPVEEIKRLAETEALDAARSYKNFRDEIESAEKAYDTIGRALTGKPAELTIKEPDLDKTGLQVNGSDPSGAANSGHRQHGPSVGAVVGQILNEMDREI